MTRTLLKRRLLYGLRRLGPLGWLGLAAMAGALAWLAFVVAPAWERQRQLDRAVAAAAIELSQCTVGERAATPAEQLAAFYRGFPKGTAIPDWLGKIYALAGDYRLSLELGEYALTEAKSDRLDQFRIVFPVKGAYPQIRRFIAAVLSTAPGLALDSLSLRREKIGDGSVEARIVFLLYLEKT